MGTGAPRVAVCIMAKVPEAGRVKTGLCPSLSPIESADLARLTAELAGSPGLARHTRSFVLGRLAGRTAGLGKSV